MTPSPASRRDAATHRARIAEAEETFVAAFARWRACRTLRPADADHVRASNSLAAARRLLREAEDAARRDGVEL